MVSTSCASASRTTMDARDQSVFANLGSMKQGIVLAALALTKIELRMKSPKPPILLLLLALHGRKRPVQGMS